MKCVVLGSAGFIGSALSLRLLNQGHEVVGVDAYLGGLYPKSQKRVRTEEILRLYPMFEFVQLDLREEPLDSILEGVSVVFNEAAMPGLGPSWSDFETYLSCNVLATYKVLDSISRFPSVHLVHASTSSVYGLFANGDESTALEPVSPYGVSKLAAEKLVRSFQKNQGVSATILRYFSVYGPNQRSDMAYAKFISHLLRNEPLKVHGDGRQIRSNTYIDDVVEATLLSATPQLSGHTLNVCGDDSIALLDALGVLADELKVIPKIEFVPAARGDQLETQGDNSLAKTLLGWKPSVGIEEGLRRQARFEKTRRA